MAHERIGIVGMGLLGRGIAACCLARGYEVVVCSQGANWREETRRAIAAAMDDLVAHGRLDRSVISAWLGRYRESDAIAGLADCTFVIESVPEDLALKRDVMAQLEAAVGPAVPLATNTSSIPIGQLQADRLHPERVIGMHWAAPCYVTRILEVIRGERTDDATVDRTMALSAALGKDPVLLKKDIAGFVFNRLGYAMYREAFHLLESGVADVEMIDRAFRQTIGLWAQMCGPFRWMDVTGLPAYADAFGRVFPQLNNDTSVPDALKQLTAGGALGVDNGRGFYAYTPEEAAAWRQRLVDRVWAVEAEGAESSKGDSSCG